MTVCDNLAEVSLQQFLGIEMECFREYALHIIGFLKNYDTFDLIRRYL